MLLRPLIARFIVVFVLVWGLTSARSTVAEDVGSQAPPHAPEAASTWEYVTCAVYFRMVVGSMSKRYGRDLASLAEVEKDKMNLLMALARESAAEAYGSEMAEEMFQSAWKDALSQLTDEMNRNYEFINRLRYTYDNQCEALVPR